MGEALFNDGTTARFLVMNLDPIVVHMLYDKLMPAHDRAVQAWLAANRDGTAEREQRSRLKARARSSRAPGCG
jgi:hypothetical protein